MRKTAIRKILDSRLLWVIVALVVSVFVWVYVTSTEGEVKVVSYSGVKVVFRGEEALAASKSLVVTEQDYTSVTVKLSGSRRTLSKLSPSDITAVIDLSEITSAGRNRYQYTLSFPSGIDSADITMVDSYPDVIEFYVDKESYKTIPVEVVFEGSVAKGFTSELPEVSPTTVKISGPEAEISRVDHASVVIDKEDVDATLEYDAPFKLMDKDDNEVVSDSITTDRDTVRVTLPILATKDVPLTVDLVAGGGATKENAVVDVEPKYVTLAGDAEILEDMNSISLGTIDLSNFESTYEKTYSIVIDNELQNLSGVTEAAVKVTVKGLETRKFTVTNLSCSNVTAGYRATVLTSRLTITIRADAATLDAIAANNIRAVADLSELGNTVGEFMVPVKVKVDGFSSAGAVGEYKIYVSVEVDTGEEG